LLDFKVHPDLTAAFLDIDDDKALGTMKPVTALAAPKTNNKVREITARIVLTE